MVVDTAIDIGYAIDLCQLPMITSKNTIRRQFNIEKYSVLKEIETKSVSISHLFRSSNLQKNIIPTNENLENDISFSIQIPLPGTCSTYFNIIYFIFIIRMHFNSFIFLFFQILCIFLFSVFYFCVFKFYLVSSFLHFS